MSDVGEDYNFAMTYEIPISKSCHYLSVWYCWKDI